MLHLMKQMHSLPTCGSKNMWILYLQKILIYLHLELKRFSLRWTLMETVSLIKLNFILGIEIDMNLLHKCNKPDFSLFTQDMFLITCIVSGCDYVDSVKGIGFVKAHSIV